MTFRFSLAIQILVLIILSSSTSFSKNKKLSLMEAVESKLVNFQAVRTEHGFNSKGLRLNITNQSKEALVIKIDPALLFEPNDTNYQDLMLPGNEMIFVAAGRTNAIEVQTYCAKSDAQSPGSDLAFTFKQKGDSKMIKTLAYLRDIGARTDLSQQAVWFMTDKKKTLSKVYASNQREESKKLILFLSSLYDIPLPHYNIERGIDTTSGNVAYLGPVLKLHVTIEWKQESPENLSLSIFNDKNIRIASYFENQKVQRSIGKIDASFETREYPKGDYFVRLYNDAGTIVKEIKVPLE